jgi:FkbM family methyltransferase
MKKLLKRIINKSLEIFGYQLNILSQYSNFNMQLIKSLEYFRIDLIIDVGANEGQFAIELRNAGFDGQILSFEPLNDAHLILIQNSLNDPKWTVAEKMAIGDINGQIEINVSGNSVSSSILNMLDEHSNIESSSKYVSKELTNINTLDNATRNYLNNYKNIFLKIDTQGYEWEVLNGGAETLDKAKGIMCELSFDNLYQGQKLWLEIIDKLLGLGFSIWSFDKAFINTELGRTMQIDAVFYKK